MPDRISGVLDAKDRKRLVRVSRHGTVGPTAIYYAGVTAPIISASMSVMMRNAMEMAGLGPYWQWFLSALVAALAGISWYLIFIRWSYRIPGSDAAAPEPETEVTLTDDQVRVRRNGTEIRIDWSGIDAVKSHRGFTSIKASSGDAFIIPDSWFNNDRQARKQFVARLKQKAGV